MGGAHGTATRCRERLPHEVADGGAGRLACDGCAVASVRTLHNTQASNRATWPRVRQDVKANVRKANEQLAGVSESLLRSRELSEQLVRKQA